MSPAHRAALLTTLVLGAVVLTANAEFAPPPMPPDVAIVAPDAALPAEISKLSGKWSGKWRGLAGGQQQETALVVEQLTPTTATVIYSQGDHVRFPTFFKRVEAKVSPGKLEFTLPAKSPVALSYELQADGTLKAAMESRGFTAVSTLEKKE